MSLIIDAKDCIVGRFATVAAKKALLGEKVDIINCQDAIITGKKDYVLKEIKRKKDMGTFKGPFIFRMPDRFVRRMIRGMLPYKQEKGRKAFGNIMCHIGTPSEFEGRDTLKIEGANISKMKNLNYVKIKEICKFLGMKNV